MAKLLDILLCVVAGCLILWLVGAAVQATDHTPTQRPKGLAPHGDLIVVGGQAGRTGIDPYKPPGLPPGATIERETGYIAGLDLKPSAGHETPSWTVLAQGNGASRVEDLPAAVRALHGKQVVLAGFQYLLFSMRKIREFALVGSHTKCCFGIPPGVGDHVIVQLARGEPDAPLTLAPFRVEGTFRLRPQNLNEDGSGPLIWLYEVVGARAVPYGE